MDFQSRLNQFRQNLADQQDNFNKLSENISQVGRSVIPDKVAAHYAYMEQVGGLITGTAAMTQGARGLYKKVQKARAKKLAKANNKEMPPDEPETQQEQIGRQQSRAVEDESEVKGTTNRIEDETGEIAEEQEKGIDSLDVSEAFDQAKSRATAGTIKEGAGVEEEDEEEEGSGAEPLASFGGVSEASPEEVDRLTKGFSSSAPEDVSEQEPLASFGGVSEASPEEVARFSQGAFSRSGIGRPEGLGNVNDEGTLRQVPNLGEEGQAMAQRFGFQQQVADAKQGVADDLFGEIEQKGAEGAGRIGITAGVVPEEIRQSATQATGSLRQATGSLTQAQQGRIGGAEFEPDDSDVFSNPKGIRQSGAGGGAKPPPSQNTGGQVNPKSDTTTATPESGAASADTSVASGGFEEGAAKFAGSTARAATTTEKIASFTEDVGEGLSSAASAVGAAGRAAAGAVTAAKETVVQGAKSATTAVLGEAGGEAVASAIPFLGEAVGLGMLIHNIIKAHKHEENAPAPQLTAATPEATEQAGGFSGQMLKASAAPSIY